MPNNNPTGRNQYSGKARGQDAKQAGERAAPPSGAMQPPHPAGGMDQHSPREGRRGEPREEPRGGNR